eukprot:m.50142 g.50142  ORF g.50142 m.50142 type:complete len:315 (-) comp11136_c0_seq2:61-1005(-)
MAEQQADAKSAVQRMKERLSGFETDEKRLQGLAFVPRPTDTFVVTTPKAGTTWMQQICHQLRSAGSMEFDEISAVVPWIELAGDLGQDLTAEHAFQPRCFKTHCWYPDCPKGGKYIVVVRDPFDVAMSFFKFFRGWFFTDGEIQVDEFVEEFWLARGVPKSQSENASYFHHLTSWWPYRNDANVLWVFFEDMKEDLESVVRRVNTFLGLEDDEQRIATAVEHSSFAFMKEHAAHFDEHLTKKARNVHCQLPADAGMDQSKINDGKSGQAKAALSDATVAAIRDKWAQIVEKETGCASYSALRDFVRQEQAKASN